MITRAPGKIIFMPWEVDLSPTASMGRKLKGLAGADMLSASGHFDHKAGREESPWTFFFFFKCELGKLPSPFINLELGHLLLQLTGSLVETSLEKWL